MKTTFREFSITVADLVLPVRLGEPEHLSEEPALLLNFGADRITNLETHACDIPVRAFLAAGHRVASFDLPCHGERKVAKWPQEIEGFSGNFVAGTDVFAGFVDEGKAVIDQLIQDGLAKPGRVFVSGTSRGGYCAFRLAAADLRIAAVAGYAPVTDWRVLREFSAIKDDPNVAALSLVEYALSLAGRPAWFAIGNSDNRVGTDCALRFAEAMAKIESERELSSQIGIHVTSDPGHTLSDYWRQKGAEFLLNVVKNQS
jgi:alpha-beta hydrolase superfamily lysophospholipase